MKTISQLSIELLKYKSVLIFCHTKPDGDTLGSAVGLKYGLQQKKIYCDIVCDGIIPAKYGVIINTKEIIKPEQVAKKYDAHVAVDIAAEHLFGNAWGIYESCNNRYSIDHHSSNSRYTSDLYLDKAPAATVLVYRLLKEMNVEFDKNIAEPLLLGIVTDTANFMHESTNSECLAVASELMDYGVDLSKISSEVLKNQTKERAMLYAQVMSRMRFYLDNKLAIITIRKSDLHNYSLSEDSTEGFVDFPLTISNVEVAVSLLQSKDELFRVSIRTKGKVNANEVASEFGGGGHFFASGCVISGLYEEVIEKIVRAVDINLY